MRENITGNNGGVVDKLNCRQPEAAAFDSRKDGRKRTGAEGESLAASMLEEAGYRIVDRNWRCRSGELDIVAEEADTLVFVEVRTRRATGRFGMPEESVDRRKRTQVRQTALAYLHQSGLHRRTTRFDLVAVLLPQDGAPPIIRHIKHAF